jgi:hypothetical protein
MEIKVKKWFYEKTDAVAKTYNVYIDFERDDDGMMKVVNDTVTLYTREIIAESEKAVKVCLESGAVVGSVKGWTTWIPKSVIA